MTCTNFKKFIFKIGQNNKIYVVKKEQGVWVGLFEKTGVEAGES